MLTSGTSVAASAHAHSKPVEPSVRLRLASAVNFDIRPQPLSFSSAGVATAQSAMSHVAWSGQPTMHGSNVGHRHVSFSGLLERRVTRQGAAQGPSTGSPSPSGSGSHGSMGWSSAKASTATTRPTIGPSEIRVQAAPSGRRRCVEDRRSFPEFSSNASWFFLRGVCAHGADELKCSDHDRLINRIPRDSEK